jgi:threonylcarbamoyladenosine tRNA methylthiotransferase MtaB
MKFSIKTLGCKINQFDAGALSDALVSMGASVADEGEPADLSIIQTCTVTRKSDYQCRQAIRRAVAQKPHGGRVIVTGCYAEVSPSEIMNIPGVDMVIGNSERRALPALVMGAQPPIEDKRMSASTVHGRSRAFLKVQEGCGNMCSYCIVPLARGASKSAPMEDVLVNAKALSDMGYSEIVLTGVHLGGYGADLDMGYGLPELINGLIDTDCIGRIRLSSIEPMEFSPGLFEIVGTHSRIDGPVCRHFHVPLQSADDEVLDSMGRGYTWDGYLAVVEDLAYRAPGACIGADVIVGYPAEDERSFETTYKRIESSPINYLHVFTYSPRPGTRAYDMGDPVPGDVKRVRSARLRGLAARKNLSFRRGLTGMKLRVVVEDKDGTCTGLTDNYVRVAFNRRDAAPGAIVEVSITGADASGCRGVMV